MICPSCKKQTKIISDKFHKKTNTVERKRYCVCGNLFSTFEKFKKTRKTRKIRPNTYWKNERVFQYAIHRYNAGVKSWRKGLKQIGFVTKKIHKSKEGANLFAIEDPRIKNMNDFNEIRIKKKDKSIDGLPINIFYAEDKGKAAIGFEIKGKRHVYKIETKKKTISNVIKSPIYWEMRENIIGKPKEDRLNKDKIRKEINEYYKSICSYIKDKEFNQNFFIKMNPEMKWFWLDEQVWTIYTTIR